MPRTFSLSDNSSQDGAADAFHLILALLRDDRAAAGTLAHVVEPDAFTSALVRHRIALALPGAASLASCLSRDLVDALAKRQRQVRLGTLSSVRILQSIASAFRDAGIPLCAVKGPAFAAAFLDGPAARESIDLDVLIRPGDVDAALTCFVGLGYLPHAIEGPSIAAHFARTHALRLRKPGQRLPVELHVRLGEDDRQFPIDVFDPWRFTAETVIAGQPVTTLSPEAAAVYAAFHGVKHLFVRLFWLFDIAAMMRSATLDWGATLALARRLSADLQLATSMLLAADMIAAPMPPILAADRRLIRRARPLADALRRQLDGTANSKRQIVFRFGMMRYLLWLFAIQRNWRARIGTLAIHVRVSDADRRSVTLPRRLGWAYPAVRFSRLLRRDD